MNSGNHAPSKSGGFGRACVEFLVIVALIVGCAYLLRTYVITPYEVPSGSMETTIMSDDRIFSEKISYYSRDVQVGDIVTFDDPEVDGRTLVKRVVATGGQTIDLVDGVVYVDGEAAFEPYTNGQQSYPLSTAADVTVEYPYTVPDGYIWVMGDNRGNSADSRYFGAVPVSSVTGHVCFIYWPFQHFGPIS